jgi:hypothetical protein
MVPVSAHPPNSLLEPNPNPVIVDIIGALALFFMGVGLTEDYYRCKMGDKPTFFFHTHEELREQRDRNIRNHPWMRYLYWTK